MAEVSKNTKYVKLDDGVSFALVRTNPKLTTNTKLMYNGKKMYMESYASSELMNRSVYKNVSVKQNSTYNKDISNFLLGSGVQAYNVYNNFSNVAISDSFDNQFETLYWCGAEYIDSSFYSEEIGFVAPLYLREKLPNYFLIFRLDTPSNYNLNIENGKIKDSTFDFKTDILDKAVLLKTFDLREGSVLGNYIRNYIEQDSFEFDKSMYVNFSNNEVTYYGINRVNGVFEKRVENFENELLKNDNTILKNDKWFTEGFERNGLIFPYIMNIEYLFDDENFKHKSGESYDFARYIGLYCNSIEFGEFSDFSELNDTTEDNAIYYFEDNKYNLHRYVKKSDENADSDHVYNLTINGKSSELFDKTLLSGFEKERITAYAEPLDIYEGFINRAQYGFEILKHFEPGDWIGIEYNGHIDRYFADDINVDSYIDSDSDVTINYMSVGEYCDFRFSVNEKSTLNDIANALVKSINRNKKSNYEAKCIGNLVVLYAKYEGKKYNGSESGGLKMLMESSLLYNKKISSPISNKLKYINISNIDISENSDSDVFLFDDYGSYYIDYFCGACDVDIDYITETYKNIFKIYGDESVFFAIDRYLKTNNGNGRKIVSNMFHITSEGDIDPKYRIIIVDDISKSRGYDVSVTTTYQVEIMDIFKPNHGVLSWFPVKDFDFDINISSYGQYGAFTDECDLMSKKIVYSQLYNINDLADSDTTSIEEDTNSGVKNLAKSPFLDEYGDSLETEYDYYMEQFQPDLCLISKTVPYISKWGYYDEQKDSCENPYRLNVSKVFGVSNLSASTYLRKCDITQHTHSMPYYMTLSKPDYYKQYQYIESDKTYIDLNNYENSDTSESESDENNININLYGFNECVDYWIKEFQRTDVDIFSYFFSGKKYGKRFDRKYSRLKNGDKYHHPSTLFRGVKFEAVRYLNGLEKRTVEYNDYKFSFVYIPVMIDDIIFDSKVHFVKNDTFKFIVGIIFVNTMLGTHKHNIFNGNIDYFNKGFIYSACKNIIRAENVNQDYTVTFTIDFENSPFENSSEYADSDDKTKFTFEKVKSPILQNNYNLNVYPNIFYMWKEFYDSDNNNEPDDINKYSTVFVAKTNTVDGLIADDGFVDMQKIIFELDEGKFEDYYETLNVNPNNKNVDIFNEVEFYKYYKEIEKIDGDNKKFQISYGRYYEDYDITVFGYKKFKYNGSITSSLNAPDLYFENMILGDVCEFDIHTVEGAYVNNEYIDGGYNMDFSKLHFKEGSLRNILLNIGSNSIVSVHIYDTTYKEGENNKNDEERMFENNVNVIIEVDEIGDITIKPILEENNKDLQFFIYNMEDIENFRITICIEDEIDINHGSLCLKDYFSVFDQLSMYHITQSINNDYNVKYYSTVEDNKYKIRVIEPDIIEIEDKYESFPVMITNNNKSIVGSVEIKEKMNVDNIGKKIINRYSGYYNPIFKDILYYDDYVCDEIELPYSNTNVDYNYNDGYGEFGIIKNIYYHKTNTTRSDKILTAENPIYPAINEYALDYRDYNIFSSSWDKGYFISQDDLNNKSVCEGIGSMKDGLCMFGSKYLNLPDNIFIDTFDNCEMWDGKMVIDSRDNTNTEIMYKELDNRAVRYYLFIEKRLKRYLKENLLEVFSKYINKDYSFGNKGTIDDDVYEYVEKNLLKLYKVDKVYMYIKSESVGKHDRMIENEYLRYLDKNNELKIKLGFPVVVVDGENVLKEGNFRMNKINDFDRHIIYNLRPGFKESFGFGVLIKRK
jgi:hypothetical protein